jgi:hypothetical protein
MLGPVSDGDEHERTGGSERTLVYAGLAGLAGVLPVPIVDGFVSGLARGAALRRVAMSHGVSMSRAARKVLSAPGVRESTSGPAVRAVRSMITRFVPPVRMASRAEDAVATVIAALLLDHYLATAERAPGPIGEAEAHTIRAAIDAAIGRGAFASLRAVPGGVVHAVRDAAEAARGQDEEGRGVVERVADVLFDGIADVPGELATRLRAAFDEALRTQGTAEQTSR